MSVYWVCPWGMASCRKMTWEKLQRGIMIWLFYDFLWFYAIYMIVFDVICLFFLWFMWFICFFYEFIWFTMILCDFMWFTWFSMNFLCDVLWFYVIFWRTWKLDGCRYDSPMDYRPEGSYDFSGLAKSPPWVPIIAFKWSYLSPRAYEVA